MILKVFRYDPESDRKWYNDFDIKPSKGMTVLAALFEAQERYDNSLAFRYSCRGAVCGTCAALVNKVPRLPCRTQIPKLLDGSLDVRLSPYPSHVQETVRYNPRKEVLVEPLPHLPVIKDIVVDINPFIEFYKKIDPFLKPGKLKSKLKSKLDFDLDLDSDLELEPSKIKSNRNQKENLMRESDVLELERYTNCILCGSCFGACPVNAKDPSYFGPASLAKLYRFYIDPREKDKVPRLKLADNQEGWWGCEFHANCFKVCPKGVTPNIAIGKARRDLQELKEKDG